MRERVVVAMSGGVDSSVAAALLVEQGYDVIGVMLRLWAEPVPPTLTDAAINVNRCCTPEGIHDARAVAERLGIPFYVVNAQELFREAVVDFFVAEYAAGRTPNPCLVCNRKVRFGYLLGYARTLGAQFLATGHYARIRQDAVGRYELWRGADRAKDQSYALSAIDQTTLAQVLFPIGEYTKPEVRSLAARWSLPTAARAESQDLCFVSDGDYRRFLAQYAPDILRPGPILDRHGRQIGAHRGLPYYTVGQRTGLGIAGPRPLYVLALDMARNALIVGTADELEQTFLRTGPVHWIAGTPPVESFTAEVQIRYRATPVPATVIPLPDGSAEVRFAAPLRGITPGQAAVFYHGDHCLGVGIIRAGYGILGETGSV